MNEFWGNCLAIQLSSLQRRGLELGAQKPCETRSCVLLPAIVGSGMGSRDRKAAEASGCGQPVVKQEKVVAKDI